MSEQNTNRVFLVPRVPLYAIQREMAVRTLGESYIDARTLEPSSKYLERLYPLEYRTAKRKLRLSSQVRITRIKGS